ncbi:NAD(P)H:quinone oxidoreductase, type IV [Cladophialophora psammophila CBS 110553]|uniref:NAD(P)H:quinone oxidoreductase, type IV n=1 Tax=Cladophialophora psammophila CBS 110553 TaxID=1182543 RepID=W9WRK0_9EURO|nr:NAD(P)H:quinone oxidoreductase, type IV [Cladophialophora psammophila CBS 110553]EXJ70548.1 NAD(P)H:quinone oxidoreductase, type IV [Cladophialophora psammophila CBS 110553]
MAPKIAIIYYSMYGHVAQLAQAEKKGIEEAGGTADIYQIEETLPQEVLTKMHAPGMNKDIPVVTPEILLKYDAFLFGIATRYGTYSAQWKTFIDRLGGHWQTGALFGKYFGLFISTATMGGGQETTAITALSSWIHQGMVYVPLGYAKAFPIMADLSAARGGSPWGAGTFAAGDGSRQPSAPELELATIQGKSFYEQLSKVNFA